VISGKMFDANRNAARRRERGQSALAECGMLLPMYVVLIFSCTTFGEMGLLKKKAIMAARYTKFGGDSGDAEKMLITKKWEDYEFGEEKITFDFGTAGQASITYDPMLIMQEEDGGADEKNVLTVRGGLEKGLDLSDKYDVDK